MAKFDPQSASRAVLIEVANALGAFRRDFVVVGGWVPELLYPGRGHIGSLDVDLAISPAATASNAYSTILKRLIDAGYNHTTQPTRFQKTVEGVAEPIKLDLISGEYQGDEKSHSIQINELQINTLRGVDLAFEACDEIEIRGIMPDGTQNTVRVRVVRPEAFILIKAFAIDERRKDKDAYDVAFVLRNYEPNVEALADRMRRLTTTGLGSEGYGILQSKFEYLQSVGPVAAARVAQEHGDDLAQAQRAAFEHAQELFRAMTSK